MDDKNPEDVDSDTLEQRDISLTNNSIPSVNYSHETRSSPRSWEEALKLYKIDKSMPVYGSELPIIHRHTRNKSIEWREEQRQLNPVLQSFINPEREQTQRAFEYDNSTKLLRKAIEKRSSLPNTSFDIVSLTKTRYTSSVPLLRSQPRFHSIRITRNPNELSKISKDAIDKIPKKKKLPYPLRVYDNVTQRYYTNDEDQKKRDLEERDKYILESVQTIKSKDNYIENPILQSCPSDITKLEKMLRMINSQRKHVSPGHMKLKDTNAYNLIVTEQVRDETLLRELERKDKIPLGIHIRNMLYLRDMKQKQETLDNKQQMRKVLNKSTHARLKEHLSTPYDIIKNKAYIGIDSIPAPIHLGYMGSDERHRTVWDTIELSDMSGDRETPNILSSPDKSQSPQRTQNETFDASTLSPIPKILTSPNVAIKSRKHQPDEQPNVNTSSLYSIPAQKLKRGKKGDIWVDNIVVYSIADDIKRASTARQKSVLLTRRPVMSNIDQ